MAHPPSKTSKKRFKASLVDLDPLARYRRHHIPAGGMLAITPETHPNPGIGKTTPLETPIPWYTHSTGKVPSPPIPAGGMLAITPETHPNPGIGKTTPLETPIPWYTHINVIPYTYTDHGIRWWAPDGA
eukprot:CAMPEP_0178511852 /NCGR_PEP_ID=MMETSP0696-20121128/22583_1 /TAXON_ID=265572 /ORGANISM="Extubocellulus spinifer, Strain CCMP396" /LENGTH=128 /DNA_ID=CAMNT_0020141653 /DNA_START=367 /DNA_END=754 /DNA_ORIENTATION=+